MKTIDILRKYTAGEMTLEETNIALEGKGFHLEPGKNILTEDDKRATTVGYYPDQANGFGLLDSGTGTLDKVFVRDGKLVGCNMGEAFAMVFIGGKVYEVKGDTLI
jgi:hypothetical protein